MLRACKIHEAVKSFPDTGGTSSRRAGSLGREGSWGFMEPGDRRMGGPTLPLGHFGNLNVFYWIFFRYKRTVWFFNKSSDSEVDKWKDELGMRLQIPWGKCPKVWVQECNGSIVSWPPQTKTPRVLKELDKAQHIHMLECQMAVRNKNMVVCWCVRMT